MDKKIYLEDQKTILKKYREQHKKSLKEVSDATGIELTRLSRLESGKYVINAVELALLEEYYQIYSGHLMAELTWKVTVEKRECT